MVRTADRRILAILACVTVAGAAWLLFLGRSAPDATSPSSLSTEPSSPSIPTEHRIADQQRVSRVSLDRGVATAPDCVAVAVVDERDRPIPSAACVLHTPFSPSVPLPRPTDAGSVMTDNQGAALLQCPADLADLSLYCAKSGYITAEIRNLAPGSRYRVTLSTGAQASIVCNDIRGFPIAGVFVTLSRGSVAPGPHPDSSEPLPNAPGSIPTARYSNYSDSQGVATITSVPPGAYEVYFSHSSYACIKTSVDHVNYRVPSTSPMTAEFAFVVASIWRPVRDDAIVSRKVHYDPPVLSSNLSLPNASIERARARFESQHPEYTVQVALADTVPVECTQPAFVPGFGLGRIHRQLLRVDQASPRDIRVKDLSGSPDCGYVRCRVADPLLREMAEDIKLLSSDGAFALPITKHLSAPQPVPPGEYSVGCVDEFLRRNVEVEPRLIKVARKETVDVTIGTPDPLGALKIQATTQDGDPAGYVSLTFFRSGKRINARAFNAAAPPVLILPAGEVQMRAICYGHREITETLQVPDDNDVRNHRLVFEPR